MKPPRGHLRFDLVAARHNETLGEKIESAHDCKTDKNSYKMANSSRKGQVLFFAALPRLRKKHEGMISLVKRRHMMCNVKIPKVVKGGEWNNLFDFNLI